MKNDGGCGCGRCDVCRGARRSTPKRVSNVANQTKVSVRAARYRDTRASMIAGLSLNAAGAAGGLTSLLAGDSDDPVIATIDATAVVIDVLDFYTERLTAESLLGTAREDSSVDLMGRTVGYRASAGVAAEAVLAMDVEPVARGGDVPASIIPAGTRVASKPAPGEASVTFETDEELAARPEWNRLAVIDSKPGKLQVDANAAIFVGSGLRISIGDGLLFEAEDVTGVALVTGVNVDTARQVTTLSWSGIDWAGVERTCVVSTVSLLGPPVPSFGLGAERVPAVVEDGADTKWAWPDGVPEKRNVVAVDSGRLAMGVDGRIVVFYQGLQAVTTVIERIDEGFVASNFAGARTVLTTSDTDLVITRTDERSATFRAVGEELRLAREPDPDAIAQESNTVMVWGDATAFPLPRAIVIEGAQHDSNSAPLAVEATVVAAKTLNAVDSDDDMPAAQTELTLGESLDQAIPRRGATVLANAVHASHGETKGAILGSGDASVAGQSFELRAVPIVFLRSSEGVLSTLVIRVNGVRWTERESFFGTTANDHVYVVDIAVDGTTFITFGDGIRGARVPDGNNNVIASLRVGADPELGPFTPGNVRAGRLSNLVDRPLGLLKVRNPAAAHGGVDPSSPDERRVRIPTGLRAFRRAVAPADYADLALEQAGVAKARVDVLGGPGNRRIVVTVAGMGDKPGEIGQLEGPDKLASYLRSVGDPLTRVSVVGYLTRKFAVKGTIFVELDRIPADVLEKVRIALHTEFRAANRRLAGSVAASEIMAVIQGVPGVRNVDLDQPVVDSAVVAPRVNAQEGSPAELSLRGAPVGATLVSLERDYSDGSAGGTTDISAVAAIDLDTEGTVRT